jgi:hypothetical protein
MAQAADGTELVSGCRTLALLRTLTMIAMHEHVTSCTSDRLPSASKRFYQPSKLPCLLQSL